MTVLVEFIPKSGRTFYRDVPIDLLKNAIYLHPEIVFSGSARPPVDEPVRMSERNRKFEWWGENSTFAPHIPMPVYKEV